MADIELAFAEANKLLSKPGIHGISKRQDRIVVYAEEGTSVPTQILGVPIEVVYTRQFRILR